MTTQGQAESAGRGTGPERAVPEPAGRETDWDDLRLFRVLAEELSFTRAAARAQVSQPSLSTKIKRLERRLDLTLFDRSTHHVALTPAGHRLVVAVEGMTAEWADVLVDLRADRETGAHATGPVPPLRLGVHDIGPARLPPYLDAVPWAGGCRLVAQGHPDQAVDALRAGRLDLLLGYFFDAAATPEPPPDTYLCTALRERLHVLLPVGHPLLDGESVSLADLSGERWITREEPTMARLHLDLLRRHGVEPEVAHVTSHMETLKFLVATGQGIDLTTPLFRAGDGTACRPLAQPVDSVFLLYGRSSVARPVAEALVDAVRRWYVDGLVERGSRWLERMSRPDAHPTLRAALAAAGRSTSQVSRPGNSAG